MTINPSKASQRSQTKFRIRFGSNMKFAVYSILKKCKNVSPNNNLNPADLVDKALHSCHRLLTLLFRLP